MTEVITEFSPQTMAEAIEQNHEDQLMNLGRYVGAEVHDQPELKWYVSAIPSSAFNTVAKAKLSSKDADKRIKDILKKVKARGVPFGWWIFPGSEPKDLGDRLISHGFTYKGEGYGVAGDLTTMDLDHPVVEGLTVESVKDTDSLRNFLQPFSVVHKIPDYFTQALFDSFGRTGLKPDQPYQHYIGWMDGRPVSTASVLYSSGVAGGYNNVTISEYRKRGIGAAIINETSKKILAGNYKFRVGIASKMMLPIAKSIGYEEFFRAKYYEWEVKKRDKSRRRKVRSLLNRVKTVGGLLKQEK